MGEQSNSIYALPFTASGAVPKRRFVGFDGAVCGAGAKSMGATRFGADDTTYGECTALGTAVLEAGGPINKGAAVTSDAAGKAVAATALSVTLITGADHPDLDGAHIFAGGVLPQAINGYALEAASGDGAFVEILLK